MVEQGVWEQLRPDRGEVLRGHPAHDGRGDWMVRHENLEYHVSCQQPIKKKNITPEE